MSFKNINVVLTGNSAQLSGVLAKASREIDGFAKKVNVSGNSASKFKLAAAGAAAAAITLGAGLAFAVRQASAFDTQLRNVQSITKQTDASLRATGDALLDMSRKLPQTAETLAQGLYNIASSGFQGAEGLKVLQQSAQAASAGLTTTDIAARGITAVLNAYGRTADDAADVSDVLFQTVNLGVITFEELASELGDVVGTAAAAGIAIDDVGAAIATMTLSGISGAESTTSLNRLIQSLIDPSDALKAKMDQLGIGIEDLKDPTIGLYGVMGQLQEASQGNIETLLQWFPEIRAARGAFALMAAEGENYRKSQAAIGDEQARSGATAAALKEQMKSLSSQFRLFMNWVNAGAIELGTRLLPVLIDALKIFREFGSDAGPAIVNAFQMAIPLFRTLGEIGADVIEILGVMIDTVDDFAVVMGALGFGALLVTLQAVAGGIQKLTGFFANNKTAAQALAIVLGGLLLKAIAGVAVSIGTWALAAAAQGLYALSMAAVSTTASLMSLGGAAGIIAVALGVTAVNAMNNARIAGERMVSEITKGLDTKSYVSLNSTWGELIDKQRELGMVINENRNLGEGLRSAFDVLIPLQNMGNTLQDLRGEYDAVTDKIEELEPVMEKITDTAIRLTEVLPGITELDVSKWMQKLDLDPTTMSVENMAKAIEVASIQAQTGSPAVDALAEAAKTLGDETSDATDKLDAFKDTLDAIIGVHISAYEATTQLGSALQEIVTTVTDAGTTLDVYTEAGQANRNALSGAAQAALDHANAVARDVSATRGVEAGIRAGNEALYANVQALSSVMAQAGFTQGQIQSLLAEMGLTPSNLNTIITLDGAEEAKIDLQDIRGWEDAVSQGAQGTITLDTSQATTALGELIRGLALAGAMIDSAGLGKLAQDFGMKAPTPVHVPAIPRIQPGTGGASGGAGKAADEQRRLNEEIARNRQEHELANMPLQERLSMLDRLIAGEQAFTDEWMRLVDQREQVEREMLDQAQGVADFLTAIFDQRIEAARVAFNNERATGEEYIALLVEQHEAVVRIHGYWSDEAQSIRDEILAIREAGIDEERRIEDARYQLGEISNAERMQQLNQRLAAEKRYSEEYVRIQQEIQRIQEDINEEEDRREEERDRRRRERAEARQRTVEALADVYTTAQDKFKQQQQQFDDMVSNARASVVGDLSNVYAEAQRKHREQMDAYAQEVEERGQRIVDSLVNTFGNSLRVSTGSVRRYLRQQTKAAEQWTLEMEKLQGSGLNQDLIDRLQQAGPSALGLAKAINTMDPGQVNDSVQHLIDLTHQYDPIQTEQKSFNELLEAEIAIWQEANSNRDVAKAWAEGMAGQYMPQLNFEWKTFEEILQEEIAAQRDAMVERAAAEQWASNMINQYRTLNDTLREYIDLLKEENAVSSSRSSSKKSSSASSGPLSKANGDPLHDAAIQNEDVSRYLESIYRSGKSYDSGGYLPTGWSMAYNGTGRPEPVGHNLTSKTEVNLIGDHYYNDGIDQDAMLRKVEALVTAGRFG